MTKSGSGIALENALVHYKVLSKEPDSGVLRTVVLPGGETDWHHHTAALDRFVVVAGVLTVEFAHDEEVCKVNVHDYYVLEPGVKHRVKNETTTDVIYVLVQSGGVRDIVLEAVMAT